MSTGISTETIQDHSSSLKLWRAVLTQAVIDSYSAKRHYRLPVARWAVSDDFEIVCGMANMSHHTIRKCLAEVLGEQGSIRAEVIGKKIIAELEEI
tara:strand:+ start:37 stop:324 length:288 start_codon:yes stop_codon:yes gene_type:complete